MTARELEQACAPTTASLREVAQVIDRLASSLCILVDDERRLEGVVTDGDLRRSMGPDLLARRVGEIMTRSPRTIGPEALAAEALHAMNARSPQITTLFVVDPPGRPVGILHIHDCLRAGML